MLLFLLRHVRLVFVALVLFCPAFAVPAGQGAQRMLYSVPNSAFIENYCHSNSVGIWMGNCGYANTSGI